MNTLREKAFAKINLGLDILSKREDAYHEVSMIMHSINLYDELIIEKRADKERRYTTSSNKLEMDEKNLVCKAAELFCSVYGINEGFSIELKKNIPMAAGLAGGSSDAAAVIRGLNKLYDIDAPLEELLGLGKKIGADVPYCIMGGTAIAEGIGEKLTPIAEPARYFYLIVKPNVDVSTKWAYDEVDKHKNLKHPDIYTLRRALEKKDELCLFANMGNIFEEVIISKYPIIEEIKDIMELNGARRALMSGSGPTVFGIFDSQEALENTFNKFNSSEYECIYKIW